VPPWIFGRQWNDLGFRQPGWLLVPLRGFLGVTFTVAGLQKLANPTYLDAHNPTSVVGQMRLLRHSSPIGPLLSLSLHFSTLVGLLIAFGELAVGIATLFGLWTRIAAVGGMALSLTFFLTVSWNTTPYYYGSDIVFVFAWTVIAGFGAAGVLSTDAWIASRARILSGPRGKQADIDRRAILLGARTAGVLAITGAVLGAFTAVVGRLAGGTNNARLAGVGRGARRTTSPAPTHDAPAPTQQAASGTDIGPASAVPVGSAAQFTDPASGSPAWVVHPTSSDYAAFSAVCTHAGCTVEFDAGSMQFICPCHGGSYDARTGQVTGGPPPSPLPQIKIHVVNGEIRVD
jgi:thiosulfate dehydrogenase (quinone) large subunit